MSDLDQLQSTIATLRGVIEARDLAIERLQQDVIRWTELARTWQRLADTWRRRVNEQQVGS